MRRYGSRASARVVSAIVAIGCAALAACGGSSGGRSALPTTLVSVAPTLPGEGQSSRTATTSAIPVKARVDPARLRVAVAAVEKRLGGPQRYSEVNVTQTEVNVFVVAGGTETVYVVHVDAVEPTAAPGGAYTGPTFAATEIEFLPTVLNRVVAGLADSEVVAFSVTPKPTTGVDYIATVKAVSGEFRVLLAADGAILQTD